MTYEILKAILKTLKDTRFHEDIPLNDDLRSKLVANKSKNNYEEILMFSSFLFLIYICVCVCVCGGGRSELNSTECM